MTGRENIFMNGSIMGMTKAEIRRKFDEIVDFAGVERYIDTPVKRYSSGMTVRLGFAVAAHLEPEILVVDEVLAVGDAEFQKKAVGKMQDVSSQEGRTVLFVSHNMQALSVLTSTSILLQDGLKILEGQTNEIISFYLSQNSTNIKYLEENKSIDRPHIRRVEVFTSKGSNIHEHGKMLKIEFEIYASTPVKSAALSYQIFNSNGQAVLHILNLDEEIPFCRQKGLYKLISVIPECKLYPDNYNLTVHFASKINKMKFETIKEICNFEVKIFNEMRDYYWYPKHAIYVENNEWIVEKME
jgi:lipopolysaccharide transport system ATP-binding protein